MNGVRKYIHHFTFIYYFIDLTMLYNAIIDPSCGGASVNVVKLPMKLYITHENVMIHNDDLFPCTPIVIGIFSLYVTILLFLRAPLETLQHS